MTSHRWSHLPVNPSCCVIINTLPVYRIITICCMMTTIIQYCTRITTSPQFLRLRWQRYESATEITSWFVLIGDPTRIFPDTLPSRNTWHLSTNTTKKWILKMVLITDAGLQASVHIWPDLLKNAVTTVIGLFFVLGRKKHMISLKLFRFGQLIYRLAGFHVPGCLELPQGANTKRIGKVTFTGTGFSCYDKIFPCSKPWNIPPLIWMILVISQFSVSAWYDMFQDHTYAEACLARMLSRAYRLEMNSKNIRNMEPINK